MRVTLWKPRKNGSATTVSMTSNRTSLEVAAAEAGTTKRAEAGRIVIARVSVSASASRASAKFEVVSKDPYGPGKQSVQNRSTPY